jgi:hypothetical protein
VGLERHLDADFIRFRFGDGFSFFVGSTVNVLQVPQNLAR